jgi:alkaline phosphatase D
MIGQAKNEFGRHRLLRIGVRVVVGLVLLWTAANRSHAKPLIQEGDTDPAVKALTPFWAKHLGRDSSGDPSKIGDLYKNPNFQKLVDKHNLQVLGGPMVGAVTATSARVWVRTTKPAYVRIQATPATSGTKSQDQTIVAMTKSKAENDLTAVLELSDLKPDTRYQYQVLVDLQPVILDGRKVTFQTYPERGQSGEFTVGFGACARYVPGNEGIWRTIRKRNPLAFLFLGDNLYIDQPKRPGVQRLHYYRRQLRKEFRKLAATTSIYAIWDDHDFGKNDAAGGVKPFEPSWKPEVWRVFRENWVNPSYGGGRDQPGCWFDFHIGDVHFIMTDGRYYRDFEKGPMLGESQRQWLLKTLRNSDATFKVICSSTLWTRHADKGGADSWWGAKAERNQIFETIAKEQIDGVVLLSGDRHRADVYKMKWPGQYPLFEFTNAKLTNIHTHEINSDALFSYNRGHFFGTLTFKTERDDPRLIYRVIDRKNEIIYVKTLSLDQLSS